MIIHRVGGLFLGSKDDCFKSQDLLFVSQYCRCGFADEPFDFIDDRSRFMELISRFKDDCFESRDRRCVSADECFDFKDDGSRCIELISRSKDRRFESRDLRFAFRNRCGGFVDDPFESQERR
jgi:hypothetical protein